MIVVGHKLVERTIVRHSSDKRAQVCQPGLIKHV